jgi:hypothetical protein
VRRECRSVDNDVGHGCEEEKGRGDNEWRGEEVFVFGVQLEGVELLDETR